MHTVMAKPGKHLKNIAIWDPGSLGSRGVHCTCGKCFTLPVEELPNDLAEHAAAHIEAKEGEKYAADVKKYHGGVLYERFAKLRKTKPGEHPKGSWVGGGYKVTITKVGSVLVTKSDAKATPLI